MLRILLAARNTWNGLRAAARSEKAVQEELVILLLSVPCASWIAKGPWQCVALVGVVLLVLVVELLNTGLEKLADHVTRETHPQIGFVKDVGSAAVALSIVLAAMVWLTALAEQFGFL